MSASPPVDSPRLQSDSPQQSDEESKAEGRAWKKGAKIVGTAALVILAIVCIAAIAIGIAAIANPAGLAAFGGTVGTAITAGLAWCAEHAIYILIPGGIGLGLIGIVTAIHYLAKKSKVSKPKDD